jgi:hypothetical protein
MANSKQQMATSKQQTANSKQQTATSKQQMATSKQTANSKQQTANSKQQTANSKQQTANSKQQTTNGNQQTANSKRQPANGGSNGSRSVQCDDKMKDSLTTRSTKPPNRHTKPPQTRTPLHTVFSLDQLSLTLLHNVFNVPLQYHSLSSKSLDALTAFSLARIGTPCFFTTLSH